MLEHITPLILTYNEAPNIGRTLAPLAWARRVVVVDSFSDDETLAILGRFPNVQIVQRRFDCHQAQWNYGLSQPAITSDWVLALDADYLVSDAFVAELRALRPPPDVSGYRARFRYWIDGKPLRGSLYPPSTVLFRRRRAVYVQDGHTQRVQLDGGRILNLRETLQHDDRKPFTRWLDAQQRYTAQEAQKLSSHSWSELRWPDRVRKVPLLSPPLVALHCLIAKGCLLDGRAGLKYVGQRTLAELMISLRLLDQR